MNLLIIQCLLQQKAIYAHALWYSFMTYGSLELVVEVIDKKNGYCYSGLVSEGTKLLSVPFADKFWIYNTNANCFIILFT